MPATPPETAGAVVRPWTETTCRPAPPATRATSPWRSAGSLVAAWRRRWDDDPGRVLLTDAAGASLTAAALDDRSAAAASRLSAAGVRPGDRVVCRPRRRSTTWSPTSAVLRLGRGGAAVERGVPRARDPPHRGRRRRERGGDRRRRARALDRGRRTGAVVTPPDLSGLPPAGRRARRARCRHGRRPGAARLHVGDDGRPEGRRAPPRQPAGVGRGGRPGLALDARRPAGAGPAAVPHARARRRPPRHAGCGRLGRAAAALRPRRRARPRARRRHDVLRRPDDVAPARRRPTGPRRSPGCGSACRARHRCRPTCTRRSPPGPGARPSSATA